MSWTAIVLAGGTSRRFGSDKLAAPFGSGTVLSATVDQLHADWDVIVVGPPHDLSRRVRHVREEPAGAGPAAAILTGVRAADTPVVLTVPGDAPFAGRAADVLAHALERRTAVVAAAPDPQPLVLGLTGPALTHARSLDPSVWADRSARALVAELEPVPIAVDPAWLADVDTPSDLADLTWLIDAADRAGTSGLS